MDFTKIALLRPFYVLMLAVMLQGCGQVGFQQVAEPQNAGSADWENFGELIQPEDIPSAECREVRIIQATPSVRIEARDQRGICYAIKLMDAIANEPSSLTATMDMEVAANSHRDGGGTASPYLLGKSGISFVAEGPRRLRLSGGAQHSVSLTVDNFLLVGFASAGSALSPADYKAFGTSDSAIGGSGSVLLHGQPVPVAPFGSGGTASVGSIDISRALQTNRPYQLEVRAEDCGGSRELSEIYLIFE